MKSLLSLIALALLMVLPVRGEGNDSLLVYVQAGDSCMQAFNTFEALQNYLRAYEITESQDLRMKLADCQYKRASYRQVAELLKNIPEDSLSHEAFRQLAFSYQKQGDNDSFMYWAEQLIYRYPMDSEVVAGLTLAFARANQPQRGIVCGLKYSQRDSTNIMVNLISGMQHAGCAYRLGVVCVDTQRYPEGLGYLNLAKELLRPDTTIMKAITLSQGEGYYLTQHYPEAVEAWKEHLAYNPSSVATYYNIANAYCYLLKDREQALAYYRFFLEKAAEVEQPTPQLLEMMEAARKLIQP